MDFWSTIQVHKWVNGGWIIMYVISLLLLFLKRKEWDDKTKKTFIFVILSILFFFFPVTAKLIYNSILPGFAEYERVSWLFFVIPLIAYALVKNLEGLRRKQVIKVLIGFVAICVLLSGKTLFSREYRESENLYKVPDYVITISDAIINDSKCYGDDKLLGFRQVASDENGKPVKPSVLVQTDTSINGWLGDDLFHGIRQYTSAPVLKQITITKDAYNSNSFNISKYDNLLEYEYFVCTNNENLRKQAESYGFELIEELEDYVVYKNTKEFTIYFVRHGETDANVKKIFAGSGTDAKLTDEGKSKTKITGKALENTKFDAAYVSSLSRTSSTAKIILDENKKSVPTVEVDSKLNDISWGEVEGLTQEEILAKFPDFSEEKYLGTLGNREFVSPIKATSKATIVNMYLRELYSIFMSVSNEGRILIVGHSAFDWLLRAKFPEETANLPSLNNSSISVIKYDKGRWILEKYNVNPTEFKEIEQ